MVHFLDKVNSVSRQTLSTAVIIDSRGRMVGKIIVRFTPSQIGYNSEVAVLFNRYGLDYGSTRKNGSYEKMQGVFNLLSKAGLKLYDRAGNRIIDYSTKQTENTHTYDSYSTVTDLSMLKSGNKKYSVLWVI